MTDVAIAPTRTERYGSLVLRYRWLVIPAAIAIALFMATGGQFLKITNDSRVFFSDDNPQLLALEALERTFTESNNVLIAIAPKDGDVFTRETLSVIEELTERGWQVPAYTMPDDATDVSVLRIVVRDGFNRDLASILLSDIQKAVEHFRKNPPARPGGPVPQFAH